MTERWLNSPCASCGHSHIVTVRDAADDHDIPVTNGTMFAKPKRSATCQVTGCTCTAYVYPSRTNPISGDRHR